MAKGIRRGAEIVLARAGVARALRRMRRPTTAVLMYHNVVPTGESAVGDVGLHVDQRAFGEQLDRVAETHDIVPLALLGEDAGARGRRPRAVVTFDDAYQGALTAGMEELTCRGVPATIFVAPGTLGGEGFWWDLLAAQPGQPLPAAVREHALLELAGQQRSVLAWAAREGLPRRRTLPDHAKPGDVDAVLAAARAPGITLGSHSWSHSALSALPPGDVARELTDAREWLVARAPTFVDWLAYPYGLSGAHAERVADRLHRGGLLVCGGLAEARGRPTAPAARTPRIGASRDLTPEGLDLRLAGMLHRGGRP